MKLFAPHVPFAPARLPFFYGWWILVVATVGVVMSIPGQTMGVSVFTDHLLAATGVSRLELSVAYLVGTLASSLLLPRGGLFLDRVGARATAAAACIALAVTLCAMTAIDTLAVGVAGQLGLSSAVWPALVILTLSFTVLRFSGQGMLTMSSRTMLMKWFERRRGLASGLSGVFISFGFAVAPRALQGLIDLSDWRTAWLELAVVVGFGMTLVAWLFFRDDPEQCGLRMDGRPPGEDDGGEALALEEARSFTRAEALRTAGFWFPTLALSIHAMIYTGITFHIVDIGKATGLGGPAAVALFLPIAFVGTPLGLLSGWAADRVPVRGLVLVFLAAQGLGFVGAGRLGEPFYAGLMVAGWGIASGLYGSIVAVAIPNFFGRTHLGSIASVQMSSMVAASAGGPALLAVAAETVGYRDGLLMCVALSVAAFAFAALAPIPRRNDLSRSRENP